MEKILSEVNWTNKGVVEALMFILLCIALAIGSVRGRRRFYKSAAVHMTLGIGFGTIALLSLSKPASLGFVELLLVTVLMGFMLVWMGVQWQMRMAEIQQYLAGVMLQPRPLLALMSFEASCLAGVITTKLALVSIENEVAASSWANLLAGCFELIQFAFYVLGIAALALAAFMSYLNLRNRISHRRTRRGRSDHPGS